MTTNEPTPALRLTLLMAITGVLLVALLSRLWFLQVLAGARYEELAESNQTRIVLEEPPRGRILDRNGEELVKNRVALTISADRNRLINAIGEPRDEVAEAVMQRLTRLLDMPQDDIVTALTSIKYSPIRPAPIKIDVAPEVALAVSEHAELFPGVVVERLPVRLYPQGDLAGHVLGYVREINEDELATDRFAGYRPGDVIGKSGLELSYEEALQGTEGWRKLEVNARGTVLRPLGEQPPIPGADLVTTIDAELQRKVEKILEDGILASRYEIHRSSGRPLPSVGGAAVVLDPRNGEILAMASYPTFDPREFVGSLSQEYSRYLFPDLEAGDPNTHGPAINRVIASAQPPGSTWKVVTGFAALQTGQITTQSTLPCPASWGWGKRNWNARNEGRMDLAVALMRSCDTFFYELAYNRWLTEEREIDAGNQPQEMYADIARQFGFDEPTGVDLPGERGGLVPDRKWKQWYWEQTKDHSCSEAEAATPGSYYRKLMSELCNEGFVWRGGDPVNASIGQGDIQATPLQIANAYAAVANGGTVWRPHLGKTVRSADGETVEQIAPTVVRTIEAPPEHWAELQQGLRDVVMGSRGTAKSPFTGFPLETIPVAGKTGTAEAGSKVPYSWFAAYAPADAPEYVVVAMVEQGGGGSQTSAPIVRRIFDAIYDLPIEPFEAGPGNILD